MYNRRDAIHAMHLQTHMAEKGVHSSTKLRYIHHPLMGLYK